MRKLFQVHLGSGPLRGRSDVTPKLVQATVQTLKATLCPSRGPKRIARLDQAHQRKTAETLGRYPKIILSCSGLRSKAASPDLGRLLASSSPTHAKRGVAGFNPLMGSCIRFSRPNTILGIGVALYSFGFGGAIIHREFGVRPGLFLPE